MIFLMFMIIFNFSILSFCNNLPTLTGVPFDLMGLYSGPQFTCLDKSKTISLIEINDDYCDCPDGSDEPGTSACNNGRFYCKNGNHVAHFIPSVWVNDGYCDCCDGSDEYKEVFRTCNNTCGERAERLKEKLGQIQEDYAKGHQIYLKYVEDAESEVKKLFEAAQIERENTIKQRTEQAMRDFEEKKRIASEKLLARDEKANETVTEIPASGEFDPSAEAEKIIEKEDLDSVDDEKKKEEEIIFPTEPDPIEPVPEVSLPDYGPQNVFVFLANIPCLTYEENEYIYKLCPFKATYQAAKSSPGSETSLGHWGRWMNKDVDSVNLLSKPLEMIYENGQNCWNGPNRSTKVIFKCGQENQLVRASEPSRCQYQFVVNTPAACSLTVDEMMKLFMANHEEQSSHPPHDEL